MTNLTFIYARQDPDAAPDLFSGALAFEHVADHVNVGPRPVATLGSYQAGNLIISKLESLGWTVTEDWHMVEFGAINQDDEAIQRTLEVWQPITLSALFQDHVNAQGRDTDSWRDVQIGNFIVPLRNIVASYGTGDPAIMLGAHYDSRIYSDKDPNPENIYLPMPGANDGGSGVGVLLELARVISQNYVPNQEIRLVFFDAEDNGRIPPWDNVLPATSGYIIGSARYASTLNLTADPIQAMILVDLVGEFDQQFPMEGYSVRYAPDLTMAIWQLANELGYGEQFPLEERGFITDDHVPFVNLGIPSVDIIDLDYEYWDTSEDTLDKIDPNALERVGRVLQSYLELSGAISPITE
jgi:hypothetical protein